MQLARVIGDIVTTRKDEQLSGIKLLMVQPLTPDGEPAGRPLVAVDSVGAGVGEEVFFVRGKEASFPFFPAEPPVDAGIVRSAIRKAGIDAPTKGASLLRHSVATAMLRGGATLDMVGAVLRHRSPDMTAHYAKVDATMLQQVAQPWPGDA